MPAPIDVSDWLPQPAEGEAMLRTVFTPTVAGLVGSRILTIAAEVNAMKAAGRSLCNLTVGDFSPEHFQIPEDLAEAVAAEVRSGRNQYPPAVGTPALREAIAEFYEAHLGLRFPVQSVIVGAGARPPIYATYAAILSPGDRVVYAVPSWNNEYYVHLFQAEGVLVPTRAEHGFMPTMEDLAPHLATARVLHLNSPLNPCGTCIDADTLRAVAQAVVAENRRRHDTGERALILLYDMVYWLLTFGGAVHHHPVQLVPEVAPWVITVDAVSKWLAGTGLRVGWGIVPPHLSGPFQALLGHIGAWAPRATQEATARWLREPHRLEAFLPSFKARLEARLDRIHVAFEALRAEGLPVRAIPPQGAIYLSVQLDWRGRRLPDGGVVTSDEQVRRFLLHHAGVAVVPFRAFGLEEDTGWFRMSVGAVGIEELDAGLVRLADAVRAVAAG